MLGVDAARSLPHGRLPLHHRQLPVLLQPRGGQLHAAHPALRGTEPLVTPNDPCFCFCAFVLFIQYVANRSYSGKCSRVAASLSADLGSSDPHGSSAEVPQTKCRAAHQIKPTTLKHQQIPVVATSEPSSRFRLRLLM